MVYSTALSGLNSSGANSIYIGNDQSIAPFKGAIDHVRVYRGALDWQAIGTQAQEFAEP